LQHEPKHEQQLHRSDTITLFLFTIHSVPTGLDSLSNFLRSVGAARL